MSYLHKNRLWTGMLLLLAAAYNLYYYCLLKAADFWQMIYINILLGLTVLAVTGADAYRYYKKQAFKKELLNCNYIIWPELADGENLEIIRHDADILEEQLRVQFDLNCDLQDYIAKWCHEIKLPLSASLLMNEKIKDAKLRTSQRKQLETIRQQLNGAMLGCKVQSSLFDLKVCSADILQCIKTAVHNNQYFLIQKQFEIKIQASPLNVYTDPSWLVYVIDQLIQNAVKYCSINPVLCIGCVEKEKEIELTVEDNGEGIQPKDIRRIFDRGYTGSNHHNGEYKSTGMGLYMASQILERLGHQITVESEYGVYTRFHILLEKARTAYL